jgi:hypothetical protein
MVSSGGAPVGGGRSAVAGCAQADAELEGTHWRAMDVEQKQQQHAPSNNKRAQLKDVRRRWTTCSGRAHARTTCGGTRGHTMRGSNTLAGRRWTLRCDARKWTRRAWPRRRMMSHSDVWAGDDSAQVVDGERRQIAHDCGERGG